MKQRLAFYFKKFPALSYAGTLVFFILVEGLSSFCTTNSNPVECPPFTDTNYDSWFPYQPNQRIYFTSNLGKKDSITIQNSVKSPAFTGNGSCDANAHIMSAETGTSGSKLFVNYTYYSNNNALNINFFGLNINGSLQGNNIFPNSGSDITQSFQPSITLNNKTFTDVLQLQRDTAANKQPGTYKIYIAKNTGFVGFELYPSLERWAKE